MKYKGFIKKSRTLDLAALSQILDVVGTIFVLYSPEQLGLKVGVYMAIRMILNGLVAYLRYETKGPIGEKDEHDL